MPWNEKKKYKEPKGVQYPRRGLENLLPVLSESVLFVAGAPLSALFGCWEAPQIV